MQNPSFLILWSLEGPESRYKRRGERSKQGGQQVGEEEKAKS